MNFDSVDIDGRLSVSVRDLKSMVVHNKKLNICHDFDLVFSDAVTGQEYNDENFQIPSGSSVIIKRVPAGSVPLDLACSGSFVNIAIKKTNEVKPSQPKIEEINFDDFGVDLCPALNGNLSCSDVDDVDKNICVGSERENIDTTRTSEPHNTGCQKLEASNVNEAIRRGAVHSGIEEDLLQTESKSDVPQFTKLELVIKTNASAMENGNFPSELKCSLCNTLFKEAVMIPCCQHSFCEKCIRLVLVEKARCPKCFSSKCRLEDLLPNVSLRQAIEHFLESQILISGSENAYHRYVPDGESGIQAKDVSCAVTNLQREPELADSPSATGRGSNQIVADCDSVIRNNTGSCVNHLGADNSLKSCTLPYKVKQIDAEVHGSAQPVDFKRRPLDLNEFAECHGESQPIHVEAEFSNKRKRGLWVDTSGADKSFIESGRNRKDRTCYMCGSPNHLIRDCPAALSPNPMLQQGALCGHAPPFWNGPSLAHGRPIANIYGNHGMMPFNATMAPTTQFAVPAYMPSMFGGIPAYGFDMEASCSGYTMMGGPRTPVGVNAGRLGRSRVLHHQDCEKKQKLSNINMSEQSYDDDEDENVNIKHRYDEAERLHDKKSHFSKERSVSFSEGSFTHWSHKRHWCYSNLDDDRHSFDKKYKKNSCSSYPCRERRPCYQLSEVEDMPSSSSWHGDERHKKHSRQSKKHNEREQFHSDSSWSRHAVKEKDGERKKLKSDVKRHNHKPDSCSESGLEPSYSSDRKKKQKEKDLSHGSRHSRHKSKSMDDEPSHDRWLMVKGSDEDHGEDYRYSERKSGYIKYS
ncbi:hypothetical protein KPL71_002316 [Citrus sinensis]|uniref:Uncharacterized protein n=1 Tax=Citrus sinensis TaxID=2711 RepID=A0ACB8P3W7_CITSI|nr:hypothetical protein KPL71_002316 [Citrus sinensis]